MLSEAAKARLPLFWGYPRIGERAPWLPIGNWPTPVTEARHFADAHGLRALYVKREDRSHPQCGGNKIRGLEFILADAGRHNARTILVFGTAGSHHIRASAWHARQLGIGTVALVVSQPPAEYVRRNLLIGLEAGTRFVQANYLTLLPKLFARLLWTSLRVRPKTLVAPPSRRCRHRRDACATGLLRRTLGKAGGRLYCIPVGGTSPLSCLGHVSAAMELKQQIAAGLLPEPDFLYVAAGSMGTAAGLTLGCRLAGLKTRIVAVVVSHRWYCTPGRCARLARRTHRLMQRLDSDVPDLNVTRADFDVITTALGRGYAQFTQESVDLALQMGEGRNIEMDGTYTAKTLAGAMHYIRRHRLQDKVHLFWHTYHPPPEIACPDALVDALPAALQRYFRRDNQPLDALLRALPSEGV